jgi:hypothetical protein
MRCCAWASPPQRTRPLAKLPFTRNSAWASPAQRIHRSQLCIDMLTICAPASAPQQTRSYDLITSSPPPVPWLCVRSQIDYGQTRNESQERSLMQTRSERKERPAA